MTRWAAFLLIPFLVVAFANERNLALLSGNWPATPQTIRVRYVPIALKYRQQLCRIVEIEPRTGCLVRLSADSPVPLWGPTVTLLEPQPEPKRIDPLYCLMSLQI